MERGKIKNSVCSDLHLQKHLVALSMDQFCSAHTCTQYLKKQHIHKNPPQTNLLTAELHYLPSAHKMHTVTL